MLLGRELFNNPTPVAGQLESSRNDTVDEIVRIGAATTSKNVVFLTDIKTDNSYFGSSTATTTFKNFEVGKNAFNLDTAPIILSSNAAYGDPAAPIVNSTSTYTPGIPMKGARTLGVTYDLLASSSASKFNSLIEGSNSTDCTDTTRYFGMPTAGGVPSVPISGATGAQINLSTGVALTFTSPAASSSLLQFDFAGQLKKAIQVKYENLVVRCVRFGMWAEGATTSVFIENALQK